VLTRVRQPKALFRRLEQDPGLFVELVVAAYRPDASADGNDRTDDGTGGQDGDERDPQVATVTYDLLRTWRVLPATSAGDLLDGGALETWVRHAETLLTAAGRGKIGRYCLGEALAGKVTDADGTWPSEPVRQVLETRADRDLEEGLYIACLNQRGLTARGAHDGGQQERDLAVQYQEWADRVRSQWPRTAALLDALAEKYSAEGRWQDRRLT
jgi:hypothetical protein